MAIVMNARKEGQIATLLMLGVGAIIVGVLVFMFAIVIGMRVSGSGGMILMALGPILVVAGEVMAGIGVASGHSVNRAATNAAVVNLENCYVVARFGINETGEMLFNDYDWDLPRMRYYVRLKMPNGLDEEFECSYELLSQVGEGMVGNVQVKGRWLGSFTPVPRV